MYFDINLKPLSGKNTQKVNKHKISGFVKLGVWWAERDIHQEFVIIASKFDTPKIRTKSRWILD